MTTERFHRVLLVCKPAHAPAAALAAEMAEWLRRKGRESVVMAAGEHEPACGRRRPDLVVTLGGDGTMLGVARRLAGSGVPLWGVNFGRVGYLTGASPLNWQERLLACLEGHEPIHSCLSLRWSVYRGGREVDRGCAINDIVLSRGALARMTGLCLHIGGESLGVVRGDGVIVATPVGCGSYTASAGGPLLCLGMDALAVTPVCAFQQGAHPLVVPGGSECRLSIMPGSTECFLTSDGQEGRDLLPGDTVVARGMAGGFLLMGSRPALAPFQSVHAHALGGVCP